MKREGEKKFLNTKEVAELLDVNEKVVYTLIAEKGLPATKATGKWLFPLVQVTNWVNTQVLNRPLESAGVRHDELLVIAGSNDLLLEQIIGLYNSRYPGNLAVFGSVGSMGGVRALEQNLCRIGCAHLMHSDEADYNFDYLDNHLHGPGPVVVNFCYREQGLIIASGNPKKIDGVRSLDQKNIVMVNRSLSTGTRLLFDHELGKQGLSGDQIQGYDNELSSHLALGLEILTGNADVGPGIRTVATMLGLDFLPLKQERFDLLIHRARFFDQSVQRFLGLLQDDLFKKIADSLGGYETAGSGKVVYPDA